MAETRVAGELRPPEPPPEASQLGAVVWLRKNLFSTVGNSITSVVLGLAMLVALRGLLGFLLRDLDLWGVIPGNSANYSVEAYPRSNLARIWVSLSTVAALVGLSLAAWRPTGKLSSGSLLAAIRGVGAVLLAVGILGPSGFGNRLLLLVVGAALVIVSILGIQAVGDRAVDETIPMLRVVSGLGLAFVLVIWLLPIASSTQGPLTIAVVVAVVGYLIGRLLTARVAESTVKALLVGAWLLSLPIIYLHVQRNPEADWDTVFGEWLPWIIGVTLLGGVLIGIISRSDRERAGVINAVIVIATIAVWFISAPMVGRLLLVGLSIVALATPTFGSSVTGRRNILITWLAVAVFVTYVFVVGAAETGLDTRNEYFGGFNLTIMLAIGGLLLSFPLGIVLALGRTSSMPIFRLLSTAYIETIRGVPLITILFIARFGILNFLPEGLELDGNVLVLGGIALFSAAYLAENVRGGLQSIPKGQYEAAKAMGMSTAQMTMLITLPQALRAVIPAIVGQVIALFKDTSLVAIVGLADFFRVARDIVPNQPASLGSILENLIFAAFVYWIFTFSFSRASQRLEKKLGVGTR